MSKGTVYARGNVLWVGFVDEFGKRQMKSTGLATGEEAKARKVLDAILRRVDAAKAAGVSVESGPMTFSRYLKRWSDERRERGLSNADKDERRLQIYAEPRFGKMKLADIKVRDMKSFMIELNAKMGAAKTNTAPRTTADVYGLLHTLFASACEDELIETTPCVLSKKYVPSKRDKDPTWRAKAVYTRAEVESLISDERIPVHRRVVYALVFLTGGRINEITARRWRDYDSQLSPLGCLTVATSFHRKKKKLKGVKTEVPRSIPVHPTLAKILAEWKLNGWRRYMGRNPGPDDLLVPSREGKAYGETNPKSKLSADTLASIRIGPNPGESLRQMGKRLGVSHKTISFIRRGLSGRILEAPDADHAQYLKDPTILRDLQSDLAMLGFRIRTTHNARRTLISLMRAVGVTKDLLRPITHGVEEDQMDDYTTLPWETLCEVMLKLNVSVLKGRLLTLPLAVGALHPALQSEIREQNQMDMDGRGGTRTPHNGGNERHLAASGGSFQREAPKGTGKRRKAAESECSAVAQSACDGVTSELERALSDWVEDPDPERLRTRIEAVLAMLGGGR